MEKNDEKIRESNFELLRIIAMLLIVAHHFSCYGGFSFGTNMITFNRLWKEFIKIGGQISVNVFILISGYFLCVADRIKIEKVIKLWLQIFFYSVVFFSLFVGFGLEPFDKIELIKHIFPITYSQWWYASAYFVLFLVTPFINRFINDIDEKNYKKMLIFFCVIWCIIPTIFINTFQSNELVWFAYLYMLGGYIRLHSNKIPIKKNIFYLLIILGLTVLSFLSVVFFDFVGLKYPFFGQNSTYLFSMQRLPIFLIAFFLFLLFRNINIKNSYIINIVSSASFGVYLIHENSYMRPFIWHTLLNVSSHAESKFFAIYSLCIIIMVFVVCTLIELIRINLLERPCLSVIKKIANMTEKKLTKWCERI